MNGKNLQRANEAFLIAQDAFLDWINNHNRERIYLTVLDLIAAVLDLAPADARVRDVLESMTVSQKTIADWGRAPWEPLLEWIGNLSAISSKNVAGQKLHMRKCDNLARLIRHLANKEHAAERWWLPGLPELNLLQHILNDLELKLVIFLNDQRGVVPEDQICRHLWPNDKPSQRIRNRLRQLEHRTHKKLTSATDGRIVVNRPRPKRTQLARHDKIL